MTKAEEIRASLKAQPTENTNMTPAERIRAEVAPQQTKQVPNHAGVSQQVHRNNQREKQRTATIESIVNQQIDNDKKSLLNSPTAIAGRSYAIPYGEAKGSDYLAIKNLEENAVTPSEKMYYGQLKGMVAEDLKDNLKVENHSVDDLYDNIDLLNRQLEWAGNGGTSPFFDEEDYKRMAANTYDRYANIEAYRELNPHPVLDQLGIMNAQAENTMANFLEGMARTGSFGPEYMKASADALQQNMYKRMTHNFGTKAKPGDYFDDDAGIFTEKRKETEERLQRMMEDYDRRYNPEGWGKAGLDALNVVSAQIPTYLLTALSPTAGFYSMFENAGNQTYNQKRAEGATIEQAQLSKAASGGAEVATEMMFGSTVDNALGRASLISPSQYTSMIGNKYLRGTVNVLLDVAGEGGEEVASYILNELADATIYNHPANFNEQEIWDNFTGSILPTLILTGSSNVIQGINTYANKATNKINQSQLTDVQKSELINKIENGKKELLKQIEQRKAEIDNVASQKSNAIDTTIPQNSDVAASQNVAQNPTQIAQNNVENTTETPAERIRRETTNTQQTATENSIINKVAELNKQGYSIPTETANTLQAIQDVRGVRIEFDNTIDGNGVYDAKNRIVYLNPNSTRAIEFTIAHELGHDIKAGNLQDYNKLQKAVLDYAGKQQGYTKGMEALDNTYKSKLGEGNYIIEDEMTNDILGEVLGNQEFLDSLAQEQPNLFQKVWNWIKNVLIDNTNGRLTFNERRLLNKYEQGFRNAYQKAFNGTQQNGVQNSLSENNQHILDRLEDDAGDDLSFKEQTLWDRISQEMEGKSSQELVEMAKQYGLELTEEDFEDGDGYADLSNAIEEQVTSQLKEQGYELFEDEYFAQKPIRQGYEGLIDWLDDNNIDYETSRSSQSGLVPSIYIKNADGDTVMRIANHHNHSTNDYNSDSTYTYKDYTQWQDKILPDIQDRLGLPKSNTQYSLNAKPVVDSYGDVLSPEQQERYKDISPKLRDDQGNIKRYFHGTQRADRVGTVFDPTRATSGPMAFFTDDPEIATNYSKNKTDTSLSREYDTEWDLFKANGMDLDRYWRSLGYEQRQQMRDKGKDVGFDDDYELTFAPDASRKSFGSHYQDELNRNGNNPIKALYDTFINGGFWLGEDTGKFKEILDYIGVDGATYLDPYKTDEKVYQVYLNIKNPFDTTEIPDRILKQFEKRAKETRFDESEAYSADNWDKTSISPEDWLQGLYEDIEEGTTHSWTRIPDWVTDVLKENGYDGIVDEGGKHGGVKHQVAIPFYSNQIKNVDNTTPTDNEDIRYSKQNNTWQHFLDDTYGKWNTGTRTNFTKTDTTMLPNNEELKQQERNSVAEDAKALNLLDDYSKEEIDDFSASEKIQISADPTDIYKFVENAKRRKTSSVKLYVGKITNDIANRVKQILGLNVNGYNLSIKNDDVRKIFKDHGTEKTELPRGQVPITTEDFTNIPNIIKNADAIESGGMTVKGKPVIKFSKNLNGYTTVVTYVSDKHHNLELQTMYKLKNDKKIEPVTGIHENNAPGLNTSETVSDTALFDNSIPPSDNSVNQDNDTQYSLTEEEVNEVNEYIGKLNQDTTLDDNFKEQILSKFDNLNTYKQFENIKQEVEDYKDKAYKGISGLVDIVNSTPEDVKQRPMKYTQRKDKNTANQRKFFDNAETSNIIAEETKSRVNPTTYERQSNLDTLEEVRQRLDERGNDMVEEWKHKTKNYTAKDVALGAILIERYQQNGDWQSAARTVEKLADMGTEAGRAVQMYSIFQRLSPETMAIYQQKALDNAFEEMKQRKTGKWVEANKDKFKLTAEDTKFIYEQVEKASQAIDDETKQRELSKIENRINEKLPPEAGQSIKALRRIAMLFNPKTQVRNFMGNLIITPVNDVADFIGSKIDKAIAKKTGVRTTNNPNLITKAKGFKKGIKDAITDYKTGTRTTVSGNKYEFDLGAKAFNENTGNKVRDAVNTKLNKINDLLSSIMSGGDRPFYEAAFQNSLEGQMKANNVTEPTQEMVDIAVNEALQRTWNDDNNYTKAVLSLRRAMNNINIKGFGLGDLIIPFAKTPANLTKAIVEYSPVGFVESVIDFNDMRKAISRGEMTPMQQKKFVTSMSKAITGSFLYLIASMLAKSGSITGSADDDKDVKNFEQNVLGIQPYSVRIGDKSYTYSWANPLNAPLAIMADTYKMSKENASKWEILNNAFKVAGETLVENSFMSGIKELFSKDSISEGLVDAVESFPESLVPTFLSQIASLNDSTQRQTFEYQNDFGTIANKIKNKLPGARNTLAPQVNTFGEEIENQNTVLNAFLNPANVREARTTDSQRALYDVYQETKDKTIFPMQAPYYVSDNGEKRNLSSKDRVTYQKASGQYVTEVYDGLFNQDAFNEAYHVGKEGKVEILKEIASDGNTKGKEAVGVTTRNTDLLNEKIDTLNDADIPLADYYILWYSQKNQKGKQAKKTALSQTIDYINEGDHKLTKEQKEVLYGIFNVK